MLRNGPTGLELMMVNMSAFSSNVIAKAQSSAQPYSHPLSPKMTQVRLKVLKSWQ